MTNSVYDLRCKRVVLGRAMNCERGTCGVKQTALSMTPDREVSRDVLNVDGDVILPSTPVAQYVAVVSGHSTTKTYGPNTSLTLSVETRAV